MNVQVGQRIRTIRENMGYSRESFSELCDISCSFLSEIERGNKSITSKTLLKICNAASTTSDYILGMQPDAIDVEHDDISYVVSLLSTMSTEHRSHAVKIMSEYHKAINVSGQKNKK